MTCSCLGEASFSQARKMEFLLAKFCGISRQRVSCQKPRIWFSPNVPSYLRSAICSKFQIPTTNNMGKYLGVPLIHGCNTRLFQPLVDKVNRRLAGWKLKSLSRAARLLLIKSTLQAIPIYSMQTNKVPANTIKEIEGLCRNFFWGSTQEHRCVHTIAWSKISRPLRLGGLGITLLRVMNEALLSKLLWQLIKQSDKLSSQILQDKYGG